ncbi:hypothetical protein [Arthrobacter sp. NPDC056493]|uniref:hypothetical protein n=1 Tax=Arthrobacter sp. NPDC056493 TaxID=3345839 RepID=UPI0036705B8A
MPQRTHAARRTLTAHAQAAQVQAQGPWTRERKIYLAIGILASLAGVLLIAFSL